MPQSESRFESFGRKLDEHFDAAGMRVEEIPARLEAEVQKVIACLNHEVVPQLRRESSKALRAAGRQLTLMAEHLDRASRR